MTPADPTAPKPTLPRQLLVEAAARMLDVRAAPDNAALAAGTRAWIEADDLHRRAWTLAERAWLASGESLAAPPRPANRNRPPHRYRNRIAAAAACIVAAFAAPPALDALRADLVTPDGAAESRTLADGSTVILAGDTALALDLGTEARRVALLRGAAYFDVRPDPARAFVVAADDLTVTVRGTAFDVAVGSDTVAVAVAHGTVAVSDGRRETVLHDGERLDYHRDDRAIRISKVAPDDVALWRQGRLAISDAPLGEVLDAVRRRNGGYVIASADLRGRRVTGVFDLADPSRALGALAASQGVVAVEIGAGVWWLRDRSEPAS